MKAQVIVTPFPNGTKKEATVKENYEQLLLANSNNIPETKWWNHYLAPLEEKYNLYYRLGKNVFQIYYHQGKNMSVNKEINNIVSQGVKKANDSWRQILGAVNSFEVYRQAKLAPALEVIREELTQLMKQQQAFKPEEEQYQKLAVKQNEVLQGYKDAPLFQKIQKEYDAYQKRIVKDLDDYLTNGGDFQQLLEKITFVDPKAVKDEDAK